MSVTTRWPHRIVRFQVFAMMILLGWPPAFSWAEPATGGAVSGERLEFNVHWEGVPAGRASLTYETTGDPAQYTIKADLASIGPVDWIYGIRDILTAQGTHQEMGLLTVNYTKVQSKGNKQRHAEYTFQRAGNQVTLQRNDDPPKVIDNVANLSNDPLTAFYQLRRMPNLKNVTEKIQVPVVDSDRWYMAEVTTSPTDKLFTPLGWFQAFPLHPLVQSSELFRQQGNLTVWVTDDARHMPLRVETKVRIGAVTADLIGYVDGRGETRSLHNP
ncbi:MAG: DUF3108 domain-containing protein [Magnetococcales bacterium]|nr:DUF3108 domain-containing protein [Magnetococcales bacterium]